MPAGDRTRKLYQKGKENKQMNWQHSKLLLRTIGAIALVMGLMLPMLPKTATPVAEAMNTLVATAPAGPDSAAISGGIYTTTPDGQVVNGNNYDKKEDVYLSGGHKAHAGDRCRGGDLENGSYYFQVTDPAGKVLLSYEGRQGQNYTYNIDMRRFQVTEGVIVGFEDSSGNL